MQLVVSEKKYEYSNFVNVQSLKDINWDDVEVLIFNSCKDKDVDAILELSKAGKKVEKLIYISDNIVPLFQALFQGMRGDIYNDSDALGDEEILEYYVEEYKNTGGTIKEVNSDAEKMTDFVKTLSNMDVSELQEKITNPLWLQSLEDAMSNVETSLVQTDDVNTSMVELFNKTSEIIEALQEGQEKTTAEIEKLSKFLNDLEQKSNTKQSNNFVYPSIAVPNTLPRVLLVKVYSPCKFLFSFLESYQHYLKMSKQIQSKILIAVPRFKQMIKKYESFTRLAPETIGTRGIQNQEIFVTFEPRYQIMNAFFGMRADLYIVVDYFYGEPLLTGAKVVTLNAITGLSDIQRYKLEPKKCIISHVGLSSNITIPSIASYGYMASANGKKTPATSMNKHTKYAEACKDKGYKQLDKLLGYE